MGLVCLTELVEEYQKFIPDLPFIMITKGSLKKRILELIQNEELLINTKIESRQWVKKYHSISSVTKSLYSYYEGKSWIR